MRIGSLLVLPALLAGAAPALAASVTGRVSGPDGQGVAGITVEAIYQNYTADDLLTYGSSIKAIATTDAAGRYRIELGSLPAGEYRAHAYRSVVNGGRVLDMAMLPETNLPFTGNADAVRNFTDTLIESSPDLPYGNAGIFLLQNAVLDYTDLAGAEVTLVPLDGGAASTRPVRSTGEGLVVTGIAYGRYRAGVSLDGAPLQLRLFGADPDDAFSVHVIHDFTMGHLGNQFIVEARR